MRRGWGLVFALCFGALSLAAPPKQLKTDGYVEGGSLRSHVLWFSLAWSNEAFSVDPSMVPDAKGLFNALLDANHRGISVSVWYDPETAAVDHDSWKPVFVVRKVEIDGKTFAGDTQTPARVLLAEASPDEVAEFALARGIAYADAGKPKLASPLLDKALAEAALAPQLKALGLKVRSHVREGLAVANHPPGTARDEGLILALADARAWEAAAPDDPEAAFEVATNLRLLGAYDEAMAIYVKIQDRWSNQTFLTTRRIATLYREMGKQKETAEWLDKLGALPDAQKTMPYHYHRGWLLDDLGQPDAAIAEYTEGLKAQPDYDGAFWRRSCAHAAAGHIKEALDDFQSAQKIRQAYMSDVERSPGTDFDDKRYAEAGRILTQALAKEPNKKISGLCLGFWEWGGTKRERSKLLPPTP